MRIGIDLGGTKIEGLAIAEDGTELARLRVPTPPEYAGTLTAIAGVVERLETSTGHTATVGVGMPGTVSPGTHRVKNANSVWLNGQPFDRDLATTLGRKVRCANDANCLALSEAVDGAGADADAVFAVILGTGVGGGIALGRTVVDGRNGVAGEWGHNSLPWARDDERPGPPCYCGRSGCIETWLSGRGLARDHRAVTGVDVDAAGVAAAAKAGDDAALATMRRYEDRLARGLAHVINVLDPGVVVLGGGVSNIARLYERVPERLADWVFGGEAATPVRQAAHGDASGVRGAAWLWNRQRSA